MTHRHSTEIDAPPRAVARVLNDVSHWDQWLTTVQSVTPIGETPPAPGSRYEVRQPKLPKAVWEVTDLDDSSGFTWRSSAPGVRSTGTHVIEDLGGGRSRVTLAIDWSGPAAPVIGLLYGRLTDRYLATEAAELKAVCEQPA